MQKFPHDLMTSTQWLQIDSNARAQIPDENFEPLRLSGGSDDPQHDRSLNVASNVAATKQLTDAIVPGGGSDGDGYDGDTVSIQSENRKADSLSESRNDLNNNNNQNAEKNAALDVTKQLEKWNKVRESLYSQYGWSSENVNQNSKWDVDMTTTPTEGCQIRDKSVITGTNQWSSDNVKQNSKWDVDMTATPNEGWLNRVKSVATGTNHWGNEFPKCSNTEEAITFADLAQPECRPEPDRWAADETEVDREEQPPIASFGGAIPRDFRIQSDEPQMPSGSQYDSTFKQYRSMDNANDWNQPYSPSSQMQNQNRFPRPITKKNATSPTLPLDVGASTLPHPNDQPTNSFTAHFQQMNLQDNIMHPYQPHFTAQSPQQNHVAQMSPSPFDFEQDDPFARSNGLEESQYPLRMMMPSQRLTMNHPWIRLDTPAMAPNEMHISRWPTNNLPTAAEAPACQYNEQLAMTSNSATIPDWQLSSYYQNFW